jgi:hypothetical protein
MMFEKKCLVEPSDIVAVHFECRQCGAAIVVPIAAGGLTEQANRLAASSCQFCHTPWEFTPNSNEHKLLRDFASALEQIAAQLKGRNLKLNLEIKCPE